MSTEEMQFRSAAFGGFNRDDVLSYIQRMTQRHQEEQTVLQTQLLDLEQQLQQARAQSRELQEQVQAARALQTVHEAVPDENPELEDLKSERDAAAERANLAQQERDALREEKAALETDLENLQAQLAAQSQQGGDALQQLSALREENAQLQQEKNSLTEALSAAQGEAASLRQQLADWEPNINSYGILRNQVGEIELDARARSTALIHQAQQRAQQQEQDAYTQAEATIRHAEQQFRQVQSGADATLAHLSQELSRLQQELSQLANTLDEDSSALSRLHVPPQEKIGEKAGEPNE